MRALIKNVVVNRKWLIEENLLAICINSCHNLLILGWKVIETEILILYEEYMGTWSNWSMLFSFNFEDNHTIVISCSEIVERRVCWKNPKSVCIFSCLRDLDSSIEVPESKGFIFRVRNQYLHSWMEDNARYIVCMSFKSIHFPMFISGESPEFDGLVISPRGHNFVCRMEGHPVDSLFVAFDNMLNLYFSPSKYFIRSAALLLHTLLL